MIKLLTHDIPAMVFGPYFIIGIIVFIRSCLSPAKKKFRTLFFLGLLAIAMIFLRLLLVPIMHSSRYSINLVPLFIVSTSFFIFNLSSVFRVFQFRGNQALIRAHSFPPIAFSFVLCAISLYSILHVNQHADYPIKIKDLIQRNSKKDFFVYSNFANDIGRLSYYFDQRVEPIEFKVDEMMDYFLQKDYELRNIKGMHYFLIHLDASSEYINNEQLEACGLKKRWKEIGKFYLSRNRKKMIVVFSYDPELPNIDDLGFQIDISNNLCPNGDFEVIASRNQVMMLPPKCHQNLIPAQWGIGRHGWNDDNFPEIYLTKECSLAGIYSLFLDNHNLLPPVRIESGSMPVKNGELRCIIRGEGDKIAKVRMTLLYKDHDKHKTADSFIFLVHPNDLIHVKVDILKQLFGSADTFYLDFNVNGAVTLDNVCFLAPE